MSMKRRLATLAAMFGLFAGAGTATATRPDVANALPAQMATRPVKKRVTLPPGSNPKAPHRGIRWRPLGSPLTIRVRQNLHWGHTWLARKIAAARHAASLTAMKSAA